MNTQQQSRPVITPAMREQAAKQPNTWLYVVDPIFTDPNAEVPPWGFIGGYRVDEHGELTDDFSPNPNYRPSPVALRLPAPRNDIERALQLTTTGYAQGQTLLTALLDAELILFSQPQGTGLVTMEHESGRRQLQVFTSDAYLPNSWTSWQRVSGRQVATNNLAGTDIQINPTSQVKARIPGEDLLKATAAAPATAEPKQPPTPRATPAASPQAPPAEATQPVPPAMLGKASASDDDAGTEKAAPHTPDSGFRTRLLGSLLAAAAGDALAGPVHAATIDEIRERCGADGVTEYDRERTGAFGTEMQVSLFTLEGLIRAHATVRSWPTENPMPVLQLAYQRWLHSHGVSWAEAAGPLNEQHSEPDSWLLDRTELCDGTVPEAPLADAARRFASSEAAPSGLRSPDGVVRAGQVALWAEDTGEVFEVAARAAALTCPHPGDHLAAGATAVIVHGLLRAETLADSVRAARAILVTFAGHEECDEALQAALDLAEKGTPSPEELADTLGAGDTGSQALAIAIAATASTSGIGMAVLTATNHSGPSASTATLCGSIAGALHGAAQVPGVWLRDLKHRDLIEELVRDALLEFSPKPPEDANWARRYPVARDASGVAFPDLLEPLAEPADSEPAAGSPVADSPVAESPVDSPGAEPEVTTTVSAAAVQQADDAVAEVVATNVPVPSTEDGDDADAGDTTATDADENGATAASATTEQESDATLDEAQEAPDTSETASESPDPHTSRMTEPDDADIHDDASGVSGDAQGSGAAATAAVASAAAIGAGLASSAATKEPSPAAPVPEQDSRDDRTTDQPTSDEPDTTEDEQSAPALEDPEEDTEQEPATSVEVADRGTDTELSTSDSAASGAASGVTSESASAPESASASASAEAENPAGDQISDEEFRLLTALRHFRDADDDSSAGLSQDLRKLLEEAFGSDRASQLLGEAVENSEPRTAPETAEEAHPVAPPTPELSPAQRRLGGVLGGAVGDALGAPWTFTALHDIRDDHPDGPREFSEVFGSKGAATAITQQSLCVLDGLLRTAIRSRLRGVAAHEPSTVRSTLHHWLGAQGVPCPTPLPTGPLAAAIGEQGQRFPDEVTPTALVTHRKTPTVCEPPNDARSPMAVTRGASVGFYAGNLDHAVTLGCDIAVVTHGHPDGYFPAGALAGLVHSLDSGSALRDAVGSVLDELDQREGAEATAEALRSALKATSGGPLAPDDLAALGTGWTAPEALGIGLAAALSYPDDFPSGVSLATAHSGNSVATTAICGSLLGAALGRDAIPTDLLEQLEVREIAEQLVTDLLRMGEVYTDQAMPEWAKSYRA